MRDSGADAGSVGHVLATIRQKHSTTVPSRDALMLFEYRNEKETLLNAVGHDFATTDHPISDRLFRVTPNGIALLLQAHVAGTSSVRLEDAICTRRPIAMRVTQVTLPPQKSPSLWEGRPKAGEGELNGTIARSTSPSPRFARPSRGEGDYEKELTEGVNSPLRNQLRSIHFNLLFNDFNPFRINRPLRHHP